MLFITNRVFKEGPTPIDSQRTPTGLPRPVHFELDNNQAEQSVYFCERKGNKDYLEIGSEDFFERIKDDRSYDQILLFFHGYSNLPERSIFENAKTLQELLNKQADNESSQTRVLVIPLIWPCDNDFGFVKDYFDDQMAADASGYAFARLLQKFLAWQAKGTCQKRMNILAHSMGNRVFARTLEVSVQLGKLRGIPLMFRNVFLVAADILNEALEPKGEGRYIPQSARNVVVYYAADDLAMRASKVANLGEAVSRRLGHTGPENIARVPNNVYEIDCDEFNNDYDKPTGHSYFLDDTERNPGLACQHIWQCLKTGRVPVDTSLPDFRGGRGVVLGKSNTTEHSA